MNELKDKLKLLKDTLPINISITNDKITYKKPIPFAIKSNYIIYKIDIDNIEAVILVNKYETGTLKKHIKLFEDSLDLPIILVLNTINSSMKKYLIDNRISFISDDSIYLPHLLIYLNNFKIKKNNRSKKLSKLTQVILIDLLLNYKSKFDIENPIDVTTLVKQWNVSSMTISRVLKQLVEFNYLQYITKVRKRYYYINDNMDIDKLLTNLNYPITDKVYIKDTDLKCFENKSLSSYSALSYYTNITQSKNIYAVQKDYFNNILTQNNDIVIYDKDYDDSLIELELWKYKTNIINNNMVDKISLYIILKKNIDLEDVRFIDAINELYEQIKIDIRKDL
jgi:hypothetical protein